MSRPSSPLPLLLALSLFGAGCVSDITSPHVAETFKADAGVETIPLQNGFGALPAIPVPESHVTVKLTKSLPPIPNRVTVLRLRPGTPNDTQLLNVIAALGLPGGTVGPNTMARAIDIAWTDGQGMNWTYDGATRLLNFQASNMPTQPLTVAQLSPNDQILTIANDFLTSRGVTLQNYRDSVVEPDWNGWWTREQTAGRCMDANAIRVVRQLAQSSSQTFEGFPTLPSAGCASPEFPTRMTARFRSLADGQDIVDSDARPEDGITLTVDLARQTVISGSIQLTSDPDRSDYPTRTTAQMTDLLLKGGLSGATGDIDITDYAIDLLRIDDPHTSPRTTYLVPSLVAIGTRAKADGSTEPFRIVIPFTAP